MSNILNADERQKAPSALKDDRTHCSVAGCADGPDARMALPPRNISTTGNFIRLLLSSGGVIELGRAAGVPTPVKRTISAVLALHAEGTNYKPKIQQQNDATGCWPCRSGAAASRCATDKTEGSR